MPQIIHKRARHAMARHSMAGAVRCVSTNTLNRGKSVVAESCTNIIEISHAGAVERDMPRLPTVSPVCAWEILIVSSRRLLCVEFF